jgi:hypothetical protein
MMDLGRPPLPPNKPYCRPLNYPEYVKDFDPNTNVIVFKATIRANGETKDVEIINLFSFKVRDIVLTNVTITWEITYIVLLQNCS